MTTRRALVSAHALATYGDELRAAAGDAVTFVTPDDPAARDCELAWLSVDLFFSAEGRPFTAAVRDSTTLRWLHTAMAGADHPLFPGLLERGVVVTTSHENAIGIAEYVVGAVLRAYQRPDEWTAAQARHEWAHHEFREVLGTRWLVVGFGAIGQAIATRVRAFGATVAGVRRTPGPHPSADVLITPAQLPDQLGDADVVVLSRPGAAGDPALVDDAFLGQMRDDAILVNVARGSLVDEDALLRGLDAGRPALAILDVFAREPLPADSPLWAHPRVVVTPHAAAGGLGRHARNATRFAANLRAYLAGEPLPSRITPADLRNDDSTPAQFRDHHGA